MMSVSIAYAFCWVVLLYVGLRYWRKQLSKTKIEYSIENAFIVKALASFAFIIIYKYFLKANDAFAYLNDSKILNHVFYESPGDYFKFLVGGNRSAAVIQTFLSETSLWSRGYTNLINDSQNVIRVNSLIYFVSFGNSFVHALLMGFSSLIGIHQLVQAFKFKISTQPKVLFWGLILLPNALLWTSGILKEPFVILGIGFFIRGIFKNESGKYNYTYLFLGILLLVGFKPYVLISMVLGISFWIFSQRVFKSKPVFSLVCWTAIIAGILALSPTFTQQLATNITRKQLDSVKVGKGGLYVKKDSNTYYYFHTAHLDRLIVRDSMAQLKEPTSAWIKIKGQDNQFKPIQLQPSFEKWKVYLALDSSKTLISISPINNSFKNLIKNSPEAIVNGAFRPFPFDNSSMLKFPSILETCAVFLLLMTAIWKRRRLDFQEQKLVISICIFVVCILLLIGWTTPVNNAIVRYRIPAFMAIFVLSLFVIEIPDSWKIKRK